MWSWVVPFSQGRNRQICSPLNSNTNQRRFSFYASSSDRGNFLLWFEIFRASSLITIAVLVYGAWEFTVYGGSLSLPVNLYLWNPSKTKYWQWVSFFARIYIIFYYPSSNYSSYIIVNRKWNFWGYSILTSNFQKYKIYDNLSLLFYKFIISISCFESSICNAFNPPDQQFPRLKNIV